MKHQSAVGQTGWAAFDWTFNQNGPQLVFVGGSCDAARIQMDRYRRALQTVASGCQWHVTAWSTRDFYLRYMQDGTLSYTMYANIKPQKTPPVDVAILNIREARNQAPTFPQNQYLNRATTQPLDFQSDQVFGLTQTIVLPSLGARYTQILDFLQDAQTGFAPIRIFVIGFHNVGWALGISFP